MKKYIFVIVLSSILASCSDNTTETKHENGKTKEKYTVDSDQKRHGEYLAYNDKGVLIEKSTYTHGVITGIREVYKEDTGLIDVKESYDQAGLLSGPHITYHPDGKTIMIEKNYVNNAIQGILKAYYPNGKLKEQVTIKDNNENGPFTEYFMNGAIQWQGTYRNGDNEYGELIEYDSLGTIIKKMQCDSLAICRTTWKLGMPSQ
jgi:antitoxin component YwqK of YwqJK toxin-antitoxin module